MTTPFDHEHECSSCRRPFPHANYEDLPCTLATFTCDDCQAKLDAEAEEKPQPKADGESDDEPAKLVESAVDPPANGNESEVQALDEQEPEQSQSDTNSESEDEPASEEEAKPQHHVTHRTTRLHSAKKKKK
jgi:hypothetical protein